jgi:phage terminase large subunit
MTLDEIKYLCSQTYPKENFLKLLDIINKKPWNQQLLIWRVLMPAKMYPIFTEKRFKFFRGGRWGSKTRSACKAALHIANKRKARVLCTREIQNTLEESIHAELKELIFNLMYSNYRVSNNSIFNIETDSKFIFKGLQQQDKKQTIKSLANIDICIVEEAQTVSKSSLDILVPTIRKSGSEVWFFWNPLLGDDPVENLRRSIPDEEKVDIYINAYDNLFNSSETWKDIKRLKSQYENEENDDYLHVVLGEPATLSDRVVLTSRQIQDAINREVDSEGAIEIGADIARFGKDRIVFMKRKGMKVIDWKIYRKKSITETAGLLIDFVGRHNTEILVKIDDTGVGGGVTDILMSDGYNVEPIIFGAKSNDTDKYTNLNTEMWFYFQSIVNKCSLPDIQELKSELTTREYKIDMKGRKQIESKEEYKKRFHKSPDLADGALLCFFESNTGSMHFFGN